MDVICVSGPNTMECGSFLIKFKKSRDTSIIGIENALFPTEPLHSVSNSISAVNSSSNSNHKSLTISSQTNYNINDKKHRIEIICNGTLRTITRASIGEDNLLYFYDSETKQYELASKLNHKMCIEYQLKPKKNHLIFRCKMTGELQELNIWCYDYREKFAIMDIDGTITRSDVSGYIQTVYFGLFSYIHAGIVSFLNELKERFDLNIIFLTSRPKSHRNETISFLHGIRDPITKIGIPDGPVFTSLDKPLTALYHEMITKLSKEFKSEILANIVDLFFNASCVKDETIPRLRTCPFLVGFGNKDGDALAYNSVGVPAKNIILIDTSSRLHVWQYQDLPKSKTNSPTFQKKNFVDDDYTVESLNTTESGVVHQGLVLENSNESNCVRGQIVKIVDHAESEKILSTNQSNEIVKVKTNIRPILLRGRSAEGSFTMPSNNDGHERVCSTSPNERKSKPMQAAVVPQSFQFHTYADPALIEYIRYLKEIDKLFKGKPSIIVCY